MKNKRTNNFMDLTRSRKYFSASKQIISSPLLVLLFVLKLQLWWDTNENIIHTQKSFWNLVKYNHFLIVITLFKLIWHQMKFRLVPNQSEKWNYNQNVFLIQHNSGKISPCMKNHNRGRTVDKSFHDVSEFYFAAAEGTQECQPGKTTAIRRTAVWGTGVSRHHGKIRSLKPPVHLSTLSHWGV